MWGMSAEWLKKLGRENSRLKKGALLDNRWTTLLETRRSTLRLQPHPEQLICNREKNRPDEQPHEAEGNEAAYYAEENHEHGHRGTLSQQYGLEDIIGSTDQYENNRPNDGRYQIHIRI